MDKILDFIRSNALSLVIELFFTLCLCITQPLEVSCVIANLPKIINLHLQIRGAVNRFYINKLILNYQIWILSLQNLF
jgi:hypothetical protein